ncbi:hypothetical protein MRB53_012429 [Persea americana]|uniref:Uncharacterized protein n=1 Tax=Persea americana TaxID=3435 RepID=A0ACC2LYZ6_PERAE|nr:hypothetical protein MRB53_012429 [Persea americana]
MARAGEITNAVNVGITVQADWENREFISHISLNVCRLFEFLVQFEAATKSKLASLNEKLDTLERRWSFLKIKKVLHQRTPLFLVDISTFIVDDEYDECSM